MLVLPNTLSLPKNCINFDFFPAKNAETLNSIENCEYLFRKLLEGFQFRPQVRIQGAKRRFLSIELLHSGIDDCNQWSHRKNMCKASTVNNLVFNFLLLWSRYLIWFHYCYLLVNFIVK